MRPVDLAAAWAFAVGSSCFAVAALPVVAETVGAVVTNAIFVIGSVFFTGGATFQQTSTGWAPARVPDIRSWWASGVQLVGTLFFNVSTMVALAAAIPAGAAGGTGWRPDAYGSVCFLISSGLAVAAATAGRSRREAGLNLGGSVLFGLSAVGAFVLPATGVPVSEFWTGFGTFGGAVLFLWAAVLSMRA
ncbi:hypothetical protein [Leifsonia sp. AG29]|uniref:hypothetical protein n=1 Tax=Leifsonia sp. AG29 TaxID=2598860 RepID=UPI001E383D48|nr:hypothetical protein [Leifsonia sp. AG29]